MKLIDNWRQAWRWFSVQSMLIAGAIQTTWLTLPADLKDTIPVGWVLGVAVAVLVLGVIGRLIDQTPAAKAAEQ